MTDVRTSFVDILYRGFNITSDIAGDLISFTYTDNQSKKADKIKLTLQDSSKKWLNKWQPDKGDTIQAAIVTRNWRFLGDTQRLECGTFKVVTVDHAGPPTTVTIEAVSIDPTATFRASSKHRTWSEIKLSDLANQIAIANGYTLFFDSTDDPFIAQDEQAGQSDSGYLYTVASRYGFAMKTNDNQIILYKVEDYDKKDAVTAIDINDMTKWGLIDTETKSYKAVNVKYYNPKKEETIESTFFGPPEAEKFGPPEAEPLVTIPSLAPIDIANLTRTLQTKMFKVNTPVASVKEAETIAKAKYITLNKETTTITCTIPGNVEIAVGTNANITGFARRDGKYSIEKVDHSLVPFKTKLELKRTVTL